MIGTLGSIGVGLVNNAIEQANVHDQRDYNERIWHMQNAYNSPSAMADRMRAAGLNPYLMTGAEPAGSINASPPAQTLPIENPLLSLKTIAEIENINASTGRTETEAEKVMKEIALLDIALERGLIEKEDYDRRIKAYWKTYDDKSEFDLDREKTEAEIADTKKDTDLKDSQIKLNEANTATVDALRNHLVDVQKATADSLKASASLAREQCNKTKEETEKLSDEDKKRTWAVTIGEFFGLADISILAPELQAKASEYYWDFQQGKFDYESTISAFHDQINRYVEKNGHIVQSTSVNSTMGIKIGPISGNASAGKSGTY